MNDKTKILEKIQKCLRLSKSSEAHEAAAALRQAQKMMAQHGISEDDLAGVEFGDGTVNTSIPARNTVEELGMSAEEQARTEMVKTRHYGKDLAKTKVNTSARADGTAAALGREAAKGFSLHRPMNGASQKRLGN